MPEYAADVMICILGASVGLAGLLLVFCGLVFGQATGFPPATTDDRKIAQYKRAGTLGLWPFLGAIANSMMVTLWFLYHRSTLYFTTLGLFLLLLVATAIYGTVVIRRYL